MRTKPLTLTLVAMMTLSSLLTLLGCNSRPAVETFEYPPFSIKKRRVVEKRFRFNEGTTSKSVFTKYQLRYKDQLVTFPSSLDENTGVSGIWKAYYLKDAPKPTFIIASNQVFLVTEENGEAKVSHVPKNHSNYSTLQWLDSENGQPGPKEEILIREDTTDCSLEGGEYLLINQHVVLRVSDLKMFSFKYNYLKTDDYYPGNAVAFSPDKEAVVYMGSKRDERTEYGYKYAMTVYEYKTGEGYALPFERTETRLRDAYRVGPDWVNTYFEWTKGDSGVYEIRKKVLDPLPNWEGSLTKNGSYELNPVKEDIHTILFAFAKSQLKLEDSDIRTEVSEDRTQYLLNHEDFVFYISYSKSLSTASMSVSFLSKGPEEEANAIIQQIGESFNAELRNGAHQALFTSF